MTEREKLIELVHQARSFYMEDDDYESVDEYIADHLLSNGVIVPPVEIGGRLYDAGEFFLEGCSCPEIYELKDDEMTVHKRPGNLERRFTYDGMYIGHEDIGKHIFLTKEEALKALKERSEGK